MRSSEGPPGFNPEPERVWNSSDEVSWAAAGEHTGSGVLDVLRVIEDFLS